MKFAVLKNGSHPMRDNVADELVRTCQAKGNELSSAQNGVQFVFNLTDVESPKAYLRRAQSLFVFSIVALENHPENFRSVCYTTLVHTLSNLLLCVVPASGSGSSKPEIYFTTPEAGFYHIPFDPEQVYQRILPIASAHFATENQFSTDLPRRFHKTSPVVEKIKHYGSELENMGVLPVPFPLKDVLSETAMRHLYKIYGITGASYGNLSAREDIPELGNTTFWMTGRGIDKSDIVKVGKDVLLVKGFDSEKDVALVSVPPDFDPTARVSVDAVEHELIYRTFPKVCAIVHAHAWMDGILCTRQNYPCGTRELAEEVVSLLRKTDDPSRAAVGLKNHGLTITGHCLDEIFDRIRGKLLTEVKMFP